MNSLLWILQILNIYWFLFIVQFLFRVATGQVREVDDTREFDVEEKFSKQLSSTKNHLNDNALHNGIVKTNGSCEDGPVLNGDVANIRNRIKKLS
ncbi:Ceramide synthase 1, partial [Stegodyphus mimosarum]